MEDKMSVIQRQPAVIAVHESRLCTDPSFSPNPVSHISLEIDECVLALQHGQGIILPNFPHSIKTSSTCNTQAIRACVS